MIKKVDVWVLWDRNNEAACNHDGSEPVLNWEGNKISTIDLVCHCPSGCGGCAEETNEYLIGDNKGV